MADIELVIKIPDEIYNKIRKGGFWLESGLNLSNAYDFIKNGTPLPKGHGDLKDVNQLLKMTENYKSELGRFKVDPFVKCGIETVESFIEELPTIIEAGKESEE